MEGKIIRGRPRLGLLDDLITYSYVDMKRMTEDRVKWRNYMPWTLPLGSTLRERERERERKRERERERERERYTCIVLLLLLSDRRVGNSIA
jgi:hypothetical protein